MKEHKELQDKTRNNRFAEAFDYLRRNTEIKTRIQLAKKMGVNKDTITRILHAYTPFTEDAITKFQTATNCIFNLQWLRGESDVMMSIDAEAKSASKAENLHQYAPIDQSSLINAAIAAQEAAIASLKRELADKEESDAKAEASIKSELAAKDETINTLRNQLCDKDAIIATKDAQLTDKQAMITNLNKQIADLEHRLAVYQSKDLLKGYPFEIGAADDGNQPSVRKRR